MNDEKNLAGGIPEEINYTPENEKKGAPQGVSAPVLDDFGYTAPSAKKTAPQEFRHRYLTIWTHLLKAAKKRALPQAYPPPYSTTVCSTHTLPRRKAHLREYQLPCSMTELLIYMKSSL